MASCSRVILETLTVARLLKKVPRIYGTRSLIAMPTVARQKLLPRVKRNQFLPILLSSASRFL